MQRVAIARALIHDPRVLLLDEPFTGLDRTAAEEFRRLLAEQAPDRGGGGRITILVTHNVEEGPNSRPMSRSCAPGGSCS